MFYLDRFVVMQTKRIRAGQLGIVLPADSPLRIAEGIMARAARAIE